ncbi:hypothetical protein [Usitatibacter palustris]|uniref:Uncharacterized protein n=1 Tax=Usitatibacter palustris TaxID=2732487 RepID=A0A6M4HFG9_9PROT|nr:hypothetical protein [Usitatibacter palustris]QJR16787.1 hypothetical protein DSM104440_03623 [Usitatibacter palustris]
MNTNQSLDNTSVIAVAVVAVSFAMAWVADSTGLARAQSSKSEVTLTQDGHMKLTVTAAREGARITQVVGAAETPATAQRI